MLSILGLSAICIAWLYMFYLVAIVGDTKVNILFIATNSLGVLLLVVNDYTTGPSTITWLNMTSFLLSAAVSIALLNKK